MFRAKESREQKSTVLDKKRGLQDRTKQAGRLPGHTRFLQRYVGNSRLQSIQESLGETVQAKLAMSQPGDVYEQEADRVADLVMRMPEPKGQPQLQGEAKLIGTNMLLKQLSPLVQRQDEEAEEIADVAVVNIEIQRDAETDQATLGTLTVGGQVLQVLELPDRGNAATNDPNTAGRIPAGTYQAHIRTDGVRGWRLELENVSERSNIQIHVGNTPDDSTGCILPGTSRGDNRVNNSADARSQIRQAVENAGEGATIQVTITDPPIEAEEPEERTVQQKELSGQIQEVTPNLESRIRDLRGGGQPLDPATRAFMEPRFGQSFDDVRVHTDAQAAESARAVSARAYTVGRDVVFGAGQYVPETTKGRNLLAHELTHVVQQRTPGSRNQHIRRIPLNDPTLFSEARRTPERGPIEITVIDERVEGPVWFPPSYAGWVAAATRAGEVYMTDVNSMVNNVLLKAGTQKISRLDIIDHGNSNCIQMGDDRITNISLAAYSPLLSRLRGHFSSGGFVHIQHCEAGQNRALVCGLASQFGVPVYAGTSYHNPVIRFNFGSYVRGNPDGTFQTDVGRP